MNKIVKWLLLGFLLNALFCAAGQAQTINAASCNESDVSAALSSISKDGTTVVIPSGDCVWTTDLSYTQTNSFTLQGAGAVYASTSSATGQGTDSTIIEDNTQTGNPLITITTIAGKSLRITGIALKLNSANSTPAYNGDLVVVGASTSVRIDHDHIVAIPGHGILINCVLGVADHNQFDLGSSAGTTDTFLFQDGGCPGDSDSFGDTEWASASNFGGSNFFFVENNSWNSIVSSLHGYAADCSLAGRYVLRFNIMWYHTLDVEHGTQGTNTSGGDNRGCRATEQYQNTMTYSPNPANDPSSTWIQMESGTGLFWGNTWTGYGNTIDADIVRTNTSTYPETAPPYGWGYCGNTYGPSAWDGNTNSSGYPCLDGVGRGKGDVLSGALPTKCDETTGCTTYNGTWPNQALDPVYWWDNSYTPIPDYGNNAVWSNWPPVSITENTDYYLQLPNYGESQSFNGTAGIGQGTLASKPSTCTVAVGWWATDQGNWNQSGSGGQGVLYVCTATNTWTIYYTPYTYPHPLTQYPSSLPASPTNLTAVVH